MRRNLRCSSRQEDAQSSRMPLVYVAGDPLLTRQHTLALAHNAAGRAETDPLSLRLHYAFPAAFAAYRKRCRAGRVRLGTLWLWRESRPALCFITVHQTPAGAVRARHIEAALLTLARDYRLEGVRSLALAPLAPLPEWHSLRPLFERWLAASALPCVVYTCYLPGVDGEAELS